MLEAVRNEPSPATNLLVQHHPLDHRGMREESVLAQKWWARCKQNQHRPVEDRVVKRAVESRNLVSFVVSAAVGLYLFRTWPFPAENDLLQMVLLQKPYLFYGIKYGFVAMLFSTPYIAFSILFSLTYIFVMRREEQIGATRLAPYLSPESRHELYLIVGELHHPKRPQPAANPRWLIVPERGLFTGIAIFGAVGSGKTTGCMYPFAEQVLAYCADEAERRVSGLVLEVKATFATRSVESWKNMAARTITSRSLWPHPIATIRCTMSSRPTRLHTELLPC